MSTMMVVVAALAIGLVGTAEAQAPHDPCQRAVERYGADRVQCGPPAEEPDGVKHQVLEPRGSVLIIDRDGGLLSLFRRQNVVAGRTVFPRLHWSIPLDSVYHMDYFAETVDVVDSTHIRHFLMIYSDALEEGFTELGLTSRDYRQVIGRLQVATRVIAERSNDR